MSKQLTKMNWIEHGLKTLETQGFTALKAEPMAKSLKVSRGSFYWHFKNIRELQEQVLDLWRQRTTIHVIQELENSHNETQRLSTLVHKAFKSGRELERAVRAWAARDPNAAKVVSAVDNERITYLSKILGAESISQKKVKSRATFLYWAYLGQTMTEPSNAFLFGDPEIEQIVDMLISNK